MNRWQTDRDRDRETDRQTDTQTHRETDRETDRHTDRQTETRSTLVCPHHFYPPISFVKRVKVTSRPQLTLDIFPGHHCPHNRWEACAILCYNAGYTGTAGHQLGNKCWCSNESGSVGNPASAGKKFIWLATMQRRCLCGADKWLNERQLLFQYLFPSLDIKLLLPLPSDGGAKENAMTPVLMILQGHAGVIVA